MKYYRRFPGDYLRDTMQLTMVEDGAYTRLLDLCYTLDHPLPLNMANLFTMTRANSDEEKTAVENVLSAYFKKGRFGFTNRRAKKERKRMQKISAVRVNAAKSSHKRRAFAVHVHPNPESRIQIPEEDSNSIQFSMLNKPGSSNTIHKKNPAAAPFSFPPNVPIYLWNEFAKMRNTIRKPMTNHAAELIGKKLQQLETQGENVIDVVQQSIRNCWQDVFPVRKDQQNAADRPSKEQLRFERSQQAIQNVTGSRSRLADALRADLSGRNHGRTDSALPENAERHSSDTPAPSIPASSEKK